MRDLVVAFTLLTAVPVPDAWLEVGRGQDRPIGKSLAWFPMVGMLLGLVLGLALPVLWSLFSNMLAAALLVALWAALTGALHLDGFADSCDALLVTADRERRLEILHDVHLGTFGTVGLILLLMTKFSAVANINSPSPIFLAPVLGRWAIVYAAAFPLAREQGMAFLFRAGFDRRTLFFATVLAVLPCAWLGVPGLAAFVMAVGVATLVVRIALSRLGGLTGDVYGMICETVEVGILIVGGLVG